MKFQGRKFLKGIFAWELFMGEGVLQGELSAGGINLGGFSMDNFQGEIIQRAPVPAFVP